MCGIVGFVSAYKNGFDYHEAQAFRDMVVIDTLRGYDSTGVFGVDNLGNVGLLKAAMTGAQFVRTKEYDAFDTKLVNTGVFAVGHNRWATRGKVNDENAHPFCVDDKIILVQNGTYKGDHTHHADTEVDTEAIAHVLAKEDDIEKALQSINASYALVWYNTADKTLYIIRNTERPLYIAYTEAGGTMFASEKGTIMLAAMRNDIKLTGEPYLLKEGCLVTHTIDPKTKMYEAGAKEIKYSFCSPPGHNAWYYGQNTRQLGPAWHHSADVEDTDAAFHVISQISQGSRQVGRGDIDKNISHYLNEGKIDRKFAVTQEQQLAYSSGFAQEQGKKALVEIYDVLPCNDHPGCTSWLFYGRDGMALEKEASPIYYFMKFDITRERVNELLKDTYYWMEKRSCMMFTSQQSDHFASIFCLDPVSATTMEEPKSEQTH